MSIRDHRTVRGLINDPEVQSLGLRQELHRAGLLPLRSFKRVPDSTLFWDEQGNCLLWDGKRPRGLFTLRGDSFDERSGKIVASLSETRKILYRPQFEPLIFGGVASGSIHNGAVRFFRAIHRDTEPFLEIDSLWLATVSFGELLDRFLPRLPIHSSLERLEPGYVPRLRVKLDWLSEEPLPARRESIGGLNYPLYWDEEKGIWSPLDQALSE